MHYSGGCGVQLKLPTSQHLCGSEGFEVSPEGKRAARTPCARQRKGQHPPRPWHVRAGTPACAWPGQGNVSGDRLLVQRTPESQHDVPFPRPFYVLRAKPISGKLLRVPLLTHNHRALMAPLLALPVMAEAPKTGGTCPSLVKASNCPARPCRWRAHSHLLLGRSGVQGQRAVEAPSEPPLST